MFTLLGREGVYLSGLHHGGLSNQLHCEFGNIKHIITLILLFMFTIFTTPISEKLGRCIQLK